MWLTCDRLDLYAFFDRDQLQLFDPETVPPAQVVREHMRQEQLRAIPAHDNQTMQS